MPGRRLGRRAAAAAAAALLLAGAGAGAGRPLENREHLLPGWTGESHQVAAPAGTEHYQSNHKLMRSGTYREAVVQEQMIMRGHRPKPSHHASTIVELAPGHFLAAWFGGKYEGKPDVGIFTAEYREGDEGWGAPREIVVPKGVPCWNPVLFKSAAGTLYLFYKVGRSPETWRGMVKRSDNDGVTWHEPEVLPKGIVGPAKNKPLELADGTIVSPSSVEAPGKVWNVWIEASRDGGRSWVKHGPIEFDGKIIQPSIFMDREGKMRLVARSRKRFMVFAKGDEVGDHWSAPRVTDVPCPNAGLDAVRLRDGRILLVYNHSYKTGVAGRGILVLAVSQDDGEHWHRVLNLEDSGGKVMEFSYPAIIQAADGKVHVTYTWGRHNIKHVVIDPSQLPTKF